MSTETVSKPGFEELMFNGVLAQAAGDHSGALQIRADAFYQAYADGSVIGMARALRDGSASHGYLDEPDEARLASDYSVRWLRELWFQDPDNIELTRELGASYARSSRVISRMAVKAALEGDDNIAEHFPLAIAHMDTAWRLLRKSEKDSSKKQYGGHPKPFNIDQYRINAACRYPLVHGIIGNEMKGYQRSFQAIGLGLLSDSALLPHSRQGMSFFDALKFRAWQHLRYAGAGALTILIVRQMQSPNQEIRNNALMLADDMLK